MLVSLSRSSFDFMSGIFDSSSQFWFSYACGDSFTHPFNPPNLGGENEPTWSYVAWLFWIPFECAPTIHVAQLFGKSCETRAHWIFSPDQLSQRWKRNFMNVRAAFWFPRVHVSDVLVISCHRFLTCRCFWFFCFDDWVLMVARVNLLHACFYVWGLRFVMPLYALECN